LLAELLKPSRQQRALQELCAISTLALWFREGAMLIPQLSQRLLLLAHMKLLVLKHSLMKGLVQRLRR
jgi:hypothetical protein